MAMGGVGVSSEVAPPSDMETIYQGGDPFMERMKAMAIQAAAAKKALNDLALGQEASQALTGAKVALADAQKAKEEAAKALADAKAKAKAIVDAATDKAMDISRKAEDAAVKLNAQAVGNMSKSDDYANKIRADADAVMSDVKKKVSLADKQASDTKKAQDDAQVAKDKAEAVVKAAQAQQKFYQDKVERLKAVISD